MNGMPVTLLLTDTAAVEPTVTEPATPVALPTAQSTTTAATTTAATTTAATTTATSNGLASDTADRVQRLQEIIQVRAAAGRPTPRGAATAAQQPRRRLEQRIRQRAVDFYHQTADGGGTLAEAAEALRLLPRTLRNWDYNCRVPGRETAPQGRPPLYAAVSQRTAVLDLLHSEGAAVGVPRLCRAFPDLARAELNDVLHSYRLEVRQQHHDSVRVLHWQVPGRVWAVDFAEPSLRKATCSLPPIDGQYPYLLAVRDLASGYQLAWLPVRNASAALTQEVLARLFVEHGAPLVLKSDNGAPFRADDSKAFLDRAGVYALFSPPACPAYNGSIEAAIGSLKKRTEQQAARRGYRDIWTSVDVEAARQQANAGHPPRLNGRTPAEVWARRSAIGIGERLRFALAAEYQRDTARSELGIDPEEQLDHWQQGKVDRKAFERALVERDYLLFTRRRIPLIIRGGKVTSNG